MEQTPKHQTPWQKILAKFGMTQSQIAKELGWHRSLISRRMKSGLIDGADQVVLLILAKRLKVELKPEDLLPALKK